MKGRGKSIPRIFLKIAIFALFSAGLLNAYAASKKSEWVTLKPETFKDSIKIKTVDKERDYYSLYADNPVGLKVKGPVRLRVITRFDFDTSISISEPYEIQVFMDDSTEAKTFVNKSEPSYMSTFLSLPNKTPGKIRSIYLDIPEGIHKMNFVYNTNKVDKVVRLRFQSKYESKTEALAREAAKWHFVKPDKYKDQISLYIENKKRKYFRFTPEVPLEIVVQGPILLKVLTRLEYDDKIRTDTYELLVFEDDYLKIEKSFQTKRASRASYFESGKLVPAVKREFIVEVPEGKHTYKVLVKDPKTVTVLARTFVQYIN